MGKLRYAAHAFAWTTSWSNNTLHLIDHTKKLGFDLIEIPLMELDKIDPPKIKERLNRVGLGVCVSTACSETAEVSSKDTAIRKRGIEYLKQCVHAAHGIGATCFSGVVYAAMGGRIDGMPDQGYWERCWVSSHSPRRTYQSQEDRQRGYQRIYKTGCSLWEKPGSTV